MQTTFLVFGLTGDLMEKKGIPALFALWKQKSLPEDFRVVGLSRKTWPAQKIREHLEGSIQGPVPDEFAKLFSIFTGEGESAADIARLKTEYALTTERLFIYLCVSPKLYAPLITNLAGAGLLGETPILIEKPFGSDLRSAQELQGLLLQSVTEEEIYRIDHFLAKRAMQDLHALWHADIRSIEVYLNESLGVEERGALYDEVGAFRDVGQNHLLEAAAAALGERVAALMSLHILTPEEIRVRTVRSQHEGYRGIKGVSPHSQTETYFKVESWFERDGKNIPVLLESGKRMPTRREVVITLFDGTKKVLPFESGTNEYETLFAEAFAKDKHRFVSMQEVEALWRFTDPIENEWRRDSVPLASYKPYI